MSLKNENSTKTIIYMLFLTMCVLLVFSIFEFASAKEIQFITSDNKEINITINDNDKFLFFYEEEYRGSGMYRYLYSAIQYCQSSDFTIQLESNKSIRCKFLDVGYTGVFENKLTNLDLINNINIDNSTSTPPYPEGFFITSRNVNALTNLYNGKNWDSTQINYNEVLNYQYYATKDYYDTHTNDLLFAMSTPPLPTIDFSGNYNENNTLYELIIDFNQDYESSGEFNQYSIDYGANWVNVLSSSTLLEITKNQPIIARIITSSGELITASTMNVENINESLSIIDFDIEYTTSRTSANLIIDFGSYSSGFREYSVDNANTWVNVTSSSVEISITKNMVVFARIRDSLGNYVTSATLNINDLISNNPFYSDVEEGDVNFNVFQKIFASFNKKFPIVYEIGDFFNIFFNYRPPEYTENYTPFEDIHLYIPEVGLNLTIPLPLYFYWEYRPLVFTFIKLSFLIMFVLKLWHKLQEALGGVNK